MRCESSGSLGLSDSKSDVILLLEIGQKNLEKHLGLEDDLHLGVAVVSVVLLVDIDVDGRPDTEEGNHIKFIRQDGINLCISHGACDLADGL